MPLTKAAGLTANQFNQPDMKTKFKNSIESVLQDVTVTNIVATDVVTRRRRLQTVTGIDVSFTLVRKVKSRKQQFQSQEAKRRTPISIHNHALLFQIDPGVDDPEVVFEALAQELTAVVMDPDAGLSAVLSSRLGVTLDSSTYVGKSSAQPTAQSTQTNTCYTHNSTKVILLKTWKNHDTLPSPRIRTEV